MRCGASASPTAHYPAARCTGAGDCDAAPTARRATTSGARATAAPTVTPAPTAEAAPAPEKNPPAGYLPGKGFVIQSEDTAYKLRVGLQAGYRFEPVYHDGDFQNRNTFFVLSPTISGNFFKERIHFWTSAEFAANPPFLLDSYVEFFPWKEFGARVGQQFTPYDRHENSARRRSCSPTGRR